MENSESSSRKISPCDIGSSGDPGDRSSPPKRGRVVEHRAMGSFLENRPVSTSEAMAGSADDDDHEEPELDLTLRIDLPRPTQKQRVQFQAPAVEDEITKLEAIRAELGRAKEENSFRKKLLSEATAETVALQHRRSKLLLEGRNNQANQATEKEEDEAEDRPSSSSNPDQAAPNMKKPQVSLRIRTEQPMIQDGCRWKKYGQKKLGSVFPRAYYRCVLLKQCPVKKRVQRCAEDPTVLITTYEGSHNHLLPDAAVATAQGTSEAMSMLLSGSLSSTDSASSISSNSFLAGATISAINPFPSVLVDYTRPPAAVPRISDLTGTIFSDPEFNAAVVAAVIASSRALGADLDGGQEDAKKE